MKESVRKECGTLCWSDHMSKETIKTVLILHHVSSLGGGTKSMIDAAIMLKNKYRVVLCVPSGSDKIRNIAEENHIEIYETKTPIPSLNLYSGMPGFLSRYFWATLFRFRKNKELISEMMDLRPDAVIFNTSVTALIAKDLPASVKKICIVRETFLDSRFNRIIRRNFEERFDGVAYLAQHELEYIHVKKPLQIIIPDCLEPNSISAYDPYAARKRLGIPENCFCSLFMGGLIQIKGLDVLLKAAEKLEDHYKFIVAGEINEAAFANKFLFSHFYNIRYIRFLMAVKKRLKKMEESGKVIRIGYVTDISPYMSICDTVIFPSTAAHQPRPCIEAGNYERSCILSDYDATREYFIDGYNALTFRPGDPQNLADKIKYLAANPKKNAELALHNKRMSQEKHDFAATQQGLGRFLKTILDS